MRRNSAPESKRFDIHVARTNERVNVLYVPFRSWGSLACEYRSLVTFPPLLHTLHFGVPLIRSLSARWRTIVSAIPLWWSAHPYTAELTKYASICRWVGQYAGSCTARMVLSRHCESHCLLMLLKQSFAAVAHSKVAYPMFTQRFCWRTCLPFC